MRLFIAVNITEETKNKIACIQLALKKSPSCADADIKWTEAENLHLTLKFLGEVEDSRKNLVLEKLKQAITGTEKFEINFGKIGVFPSQSFPRVLWLDVEKGKSELENLAQKIENLLAEIGFEKEKRPFSAHLTLGRFKKYKNKGGLFDITKKVTVEKIFDIVESMDLMKSTLTPRGPIYEIVEKFRLEEK